MSDREAGLAVTGSCRGRRAALRLSLLVLVVSGLVGPSAGFGQPLPNGTVSIDLAVIGRQVRAAIALGEQAREHLSSPGNDDIEVTHRLLDTMYRQVRLALGNLKDRRDIAKFPDPFLSMEITRVTFAWNAIRRPVDGYFNAPTKDEWKAGAAQDLQVAMATLRQVEVMLP